MARPTPELMDRLYAAKRELHAAQRALPFQEKVRQVIELQTIEYTLRRQRGEKIEQWQRPWDIEP
jgi:hypothetical protein